MGEGCGAGESRGGESSFVRCLKWDRQRASDIWYNDLVSGKNE